MMALSEDLQLSFDQKFANYQEERKMPLVTNIERRAIERNSKGKYYQICTSQVW